MATNIILLINKINNEKKNIGVHVVPKGLEVFINDIVILLVNLSGSALLIYCVD